ncbi:MAG: PolC-type DNA polymerase III [Oscillospiraceae bacterium]|nr:PolC-type DNA polymerase III [Oscillospiraceae bacterium]
MTEKIPFLKMFSLLAPQGKAAELLKKTYIESAEILQKERQINVSLSFPCCLEEVDLRDLEGKIRGAYGLNVVNITPIYPAPEILAEDKPVSVEEKPPIEDIAPEEQPPWWQAPPVCEPCCDAPAQTDDDAPPAPAQDAPDITAAELELRRKKAQAMARMAAENKSKKSSASNVILGKPITGDPIPISDIEMDSARVIIEGDIFSVSHKELPKRRAIVISFDVTDYKNSVHVNRFFDEKDAVGLVEKLKPGMRVKVQGRMTKNRFDNEDVLEPYHIMATEKPPKRMDNAPEKRVELHLHTKMSTMDATTDAKALIKRAIEWGHEAIAITDHGVAQSFPDVMSAAKDKIKVIYGVEGYYINDVDDRQCYMGETVRDLSAPFVAFDIETTGLDAHREKITEIGAVIFENGVEKDRFQTFVNPEKPISFEITRLTGISDADVKNAPSQEEAVRSFLKFAGDLPLAAHNASFDLGFISEVCDRHGIDFEPECFDTLPISQAFCPGLKRYKLDVVANHLGLPEFSHHRASDDAYTCGLMLCNFIEQLKEDGVTDTAGLNEKLQERRVKSGVKRRPRHITILASNQTAIKNLYRLITKSHLEHFSRYPIIPKSLILQHREGLLLGTACEAGEVYAAVVDHRSRRELRRMASFYDFLEIMPLCNNDFMLQGENPKVSDIEELKEFNRRIVRIGEELGKPVVATGDVHFLDPEDEIYRHVLLKAKGYEDGDKELPLYLRTTEEMLAEFDYLGPEKAYEVTVTNTRKIAQMCDAVRPLPPAKTLFAPKIENSAQQLKDLVYGKLHELYGENPPEIVQKRVDTEMNDILGRNYDVIYMSAQKLVSDSLEHGYLVGSRGSVGSSMVAYFSGITEVNALPAHYLCPKCKYSDFDSGHGFGCGADMPDKNCPVCGEPLGKAGFDIPFETFLGFGGDKVPDIDLNFSGEYQANAHKKTIELFGKEHVFRAGTIGTIAEKTAHGYVKKYMEETGKQLSKAEENRLALGCVGVKRTTGQHPGGLVVIPQDMEIADFCPAQHPADDFGSDIITTHFEYHSMEDNLLKLDELGHDDPTMIKMLEDMTGVNAREIKLDDPQTMGIFKSATFLGLTEDDPIIGKTGSIGIPEFGTGFTRQMLVDTQPEQFDTLVRLSGFSHGTDVWLGNAKDLILSGTASVNETIGCRDDIMLYLISMGMDEKRAFKFMEAVRKGAIHKGKPWPDGIVEEMQQLGVPEWYIDSCRKIQYLFPKAHAVAYVMMAFRIAWFKVHEPLAFYSAYFYRRSQKDSFDATIMTRGKDKVKNTLKVIKENPDATAKEQDLFVTLEACYEFYLRGFEFANVDIYKSDATKFIIEGNKLIPPLTSVPGLGEAAAADIVSGREGRVFVAVDEFSAACPKVTKGHIEKLSECGALGDLPETSQISLF